MNAGGWSFAVDQTRDQFCFSRFVFVSSSDRDRFLVWLWARLVWLWTSRCAAIVLVYVCWGALVSLESSCRVGAFQIVGRILEVCWFTFALSKFCIEFFPRCFLIEQCTTLWLFQCWIQSRFFRRFCYPFLLLHFRWCLKPVIRLLLLKIGNKKLLLICAGLIGALRQLYSRWPTWTTRRWLKGTTDLWGPFVTLLDGVLVVNKGKTRSIQVLSCISSPRLPSTPHPQSALLVSLPARYSPVCSRSSLLLL